VELRPKISIIGSGNIASWLVDALSASSFDIHEIHSTNSQTGELLAKEANCTFFHDLSSLDISVDIIILAIPDDAINVVAAQLATGNYLLLHTSGNQSLPINSKNKRQGCIWPVFSISKNVHIKDGQNIPLGLSTLDEGDRQLIEQVAIQLSNTFIWLDNEQKEYAHLAATIGNNFSNHLYSIVFRICKEKNIPFQLLVPLLQNTTNRLSYIDPAKMQTGPAIRNDQTTIEKHTTKLSGLEQALYEIFTKLIQGQK
jgi:predicted short-subunit dehydrogenase-like oxidoreductase (DUF2520 family)